MQPNLLNKPADRLETILVVLLFLALMYSLYEVLHLFFGVFTFALIFCISFSRLFEKLSAWLNNKRKLAGFIFGLSLITLVATPLIFLLSALVRHIREGFTWINGLKDHGLPPFPGWLMKLPFVGDQLAQLHTSFDDNPKEVLLLHEDQLKNFFHHVMTTGVGLIGISVQVILGIVIASLLLVNRDRWANPLRESCQHLLGKEQANDMISASIMAIRGVSIGVMGTAFVAAIFCWIGLVIAGIPFAAGISAVVFFLVIIQVGPLPVWVILIIYVASLGHPGITVFLVIWGIALMVIDAILKPLLIGKSGGKLPFLILLIGVLGGVAAWGFTGMFKGAIILAVFYTLFISWLRIKNGVKKIEIANTI